jgi:cell volume regulation protein A
LQSANHLILIGAALVAASLILSAFASRFGTPLLLVFHMLGMVAGEDGPGGIHFSDVQLTYLIGSVALGIILFDGGMRTHARTVRVGIGPGIVLATFGVAAAADGKARIAGSELRKHRIARCKLPCRFVPVLRCAHRTDLARLN